MASEPSAAPLARAAPALVLAAGCGLFGVLGWYIWWAILGRELGQDWMVFHTAVRAWFTGDLALIFDGQRMTDTINAAYAGWLREKLIFHPWLYPPHFLLLLLPFGLLSFTAGYVLFVGGSFAMLAALLAARTRRVMLAPAALLLFPQTAFAVMAGQNSLLTASILLGGFALLPARPALAGAVLGIASYKPQLFLLVPVALLAGRQFRALTLLIASAGGLALASLIILGPELWYDWLGLILDPGETYRKWLAAGRLMGASVFACAAEIGIPLAVANILQAGAAIGAAGCVVWAFARPRPADMQLAILLAAIPLAAPHLSSQDGILLGCAAILLMARLLRAGPLPGELVLILAIWFAELGDPPVIFRVGVATPLVTIAFIAAMMRRAARRGDPVIAPRNTAADFP